MRVLAAVVTHNRAALLSRCLDHIEAQVRARDALVVINNASTDDTVAMLDRRGIAHIDQANLGSAGGWHRAIAECLAGEFDAVWLMDDDGYPDPAALDHLVGRLAEGAACASSVVVREDDQRRFVFPFPLLDAAGLPVFAARRRKVPTLDALRAIAPTGSYPFAHLFNGALVSRRAIEAVGNVDPRFFLFGDEVDYFFRLRRAGPVISDLSALHVHPDVTGRPLTDAKLYYYIKNTLILNHRYFDKAALRDAATVVAGLVRYARRNGVGAAAATAFARPVVARAVSRGLAGRIGPDFGG